MASQPPENQQPKDTRSQILESALLVFAERGFYGASIAGIVKELGLTKQALLHYFPTKEKLYGEVLRQISDGFAALDDTAKAPSDDPQERLTRYFSALHAYCLANGPQTSLLMRELLDNRPRAENVGAWYLTDFLKGIIAMVKAVPGWAQASDVQALAVAYTWIGAINYHATSQPTLTGIFGEAQMEELSEVYPSQLHGLITSSLAAGVPQ